MNPKPLSGIHLPWIIWGSSVFSKIALFGLFIPSLFQNPIFAQPEASLQMKVMIEPYAKHKIPYELPPPNSWPAFSFSWINSNPKAILVDEIPYHPSYIPTDPSARKNRPVVQLYFRLDDNLWQASTCPSSGLVKERVISYLNDVFELKPKSETTSFIKYIPFYSCLREAAGKRKRAHSKRFDIVFVYEKRNDYFYCHDYQASLCTVKRINEDGELEYVATPPVFKGKIYSNILSLSKWNPHK